MFRRLPIYISFYNPYTLNLSVIQLIFQDSRSDITNRTLYIDNRGQTVSTDQMSSSAYSSYQDEGGRTWFSPDEDLNEFESIRIMGNSHLALHPDLTRLICFGYIRIRESFRNATTVFLRL